MDNTSMQKTEMNHLEIISNMEALKLRLFDVAWIQRCKKHKHTLSANGVINKHSIAIDNFC